MISRSELMKQLGGGGRLVPFLQAVCVYFLAGGGAGSVSAAAVKCAPVLCLLLCVLLRARAAPPPQRRYACAVAAGLALSAAGDALLVWEGQAWLVRGMAAFAGAHVAYLAAFGLRPLRAARGLALAAAAAAYARLALRPPAPLQPLVLAYALLLAAMAWRGVVRGGPARLGSLLFLLSDAILGYSLFGGQVPYKQVLVMSTYYLAQLGIALSALQPAPEPARADRRST